VRAGGSGFRIRVPASSANLGSGFDALGLALGLYDTVEVRPLAYDLPVHVTGHGAGQVPTDGRHLVRRAIDAACSKLSFGPPGLALSCDNAIPHARGLGSSAAAVVAGITAGYVLAGRELDEHALDLAAGFEGHADNAAASLFGGGVIAWQEGERFRATRFEPAAGLSAVALVPDTESATKLTRGLLPDRVPHADAAFAAGRAALAVHALTGATDLLLPALDDRLHQDYREQAWPATRELVRVLRAAGVPAAVSGAGPTVLALTDVDGLPPNVSYRGFTALPLEIDRVGVRVEPLR
jgi:homoserine kinase